MRIEFPQSARPAFAWDQALLRIGSAAGNDLVLAASQAAARHLIIHSDQRGWVLEVLPDSTRVYVNARPVRERAILRPGDVLSVGDCRMLLCSDALPTERTPVTVQEQERCTVALRALAGPLSGQVFALDERLGFGSGGVGPLELAQGEFATLELFWQEGILRLRTSQATDGRYPLRVNGTAVRESLLLPGDHLGVGMHRFVIDAPGLEPEPEIIIPDAPPSPLPEDEAGPRGEVWWLIATAAVLALGIALLFLFHT